MSWQAQAWVWTLDLSPMEKLVALAMANYAGPDGEKIRPGMDRIVRETGAHEKTVKRARDALLKAGHLEVVSTSTGRGNANVYSMPVDMMRVAEFHKRGASSHEKGRSDEVKGRSVSDKGAPSVPPNLLEPNQKIEPKNEPTRLRAREPSMPLGDFEVKAIMDAWNQQAMTHGLAKIREVDLTRRRNLTNAVKVHGVNGVMAAIEAVGRSGFCCGGGPRKWRMDFDTAVTLGKMKKLLEGGFDDGGPKQSQADMWIRAAQKIVDEAEGVVSESTPDFAGTTIDGEATHGQ